MKVVRSNARQVLLMWTQIAPLLQKCTRHVLGRHTNDDVLSAILRRDQDMFLALDELGAIAAVMVCRIVDYPRRKACNVLCIAGTRMKEWLKQFIAAAENYGKEHGATLLETEYRCGWARIWPGLQIHGYNLYKELA